MRDSLDLHGGAFLRAFAETRGFTLGRPARARVTADGAFVFFLRSEARQARHALFVFDVASGEERCLATAEDLVGASDESPSIEEKARRERLRITDSGIVDYQVMAGGERVLVAIGGRLFVVEREDGATRELALRDQPGVHGASPSPDGRHVVFVWRHDLFVIDAMAPGARPRALTTGGGPTLRFGEAEFVAQEEMGRMEGFWFSPDGRRIAYTAVDERAVEMFAIADPVHPERPPHDFPYPRPGRRNAHVGLWLRDLAESAEAPATEVAWDRSRFEYLARVMWPAEASGPCLLVQSRDQRAQALLAADGASGQTHALLEEQHEAWLNLEPGLPRFVPEGDRFVVCRESADRRTLDLFRLDGRREAQHERTLVEGKGDMHFIALAELSGDSAWVRVGDALESRLQEISLESGAVIGELASDGGDHDAALSRNRKTLVDRVVRRDGWPEVRVGPAGGAPLRRLADRAEAPPFAPNLRYVRAGSRGHHAVIIRPRAGVAGLRYPVILHVYGGPHSLMVRADQRHYLVDQWLADQGVIVVAIDGRGTPRRGPRWERAIKGSFADVPLADQVEALQDLGRRFPEMDLGRVGIYGWSFGGYLAALAVLRRPDVFKVGVAGAPVVDWRDYDTHYTERYLDLPAANPDGYSASSLLSYADRLSQPLLIVHGTADDNVYFFHALKLADALIRKGKRFDFLPLPGMTHQLSDAPMREQVWRTTADYLLRHL